MVIDAYEQAITKNSARDARHRIEHCELPLPPDRARMAKLGILASMQATHFYGADRDVHEGLGEERMKTLMPWRSLEREGVDVSFGSDWLAGPVNPLYGLFLTATRLNYLDEDDWGPEEAITIEDAIRHYTMGSARALLREKEVGSIEVGKRADMVLFTMDLREITSLSFLLTRDLELGFLDNLVLLTIVDGRVVYKQPGLKY